MIEGGLGGPRRAAPDQDCADEAGARPRQLGYAYPFTAPVSPVT